MHTIPTSLRNRLRRFGQEHVLKWWDTLDDPQRGALLEQLQALDLELLRRLYQQRDKTFAIPARERIGPITVIREGTTAPAIRELGEAALRRGEVAALVVAGGQGSRLGCSFPKGMYPVGPVSGRTLFEMHARAVLALRQRYRTSIPLLIMTSTATHAETQAFLEQHRYFGLPPEEVWLFRQGTLPAVDLATGRMLMAGPGELCLSPNGHGGMLQALTESGVLARLRQRGFRQLFYFQVDNPLVKIADPAFLGQHLQANAEASTKIVAKLSPTDKLGNLVLANGRCSMIEYSDLPESLGSELDKNRQLKIWAGSTAIHVFALDFLERIGQSRLAIPYHTARKKVPCLDEQGKPTEPDRENAVKFELFIFDVLPLAERWTVVETTRAEEFAPLKNASGPDSEAAVKQAIGRRSASWLEAAGVTVPRSEDGNPAFPLEICPLFALDCEQLRLKVDRNLRVDRPLLLKEDQECSTR